MKSLFQLYAALLLCNAAYCISPPEYKRMEGWKFEKIGNGEISITNKIVMYNPNKIGCVKLKKIKIDVSIEKTKVGEITQAADRVAINKTSEFVIPLRLTIKPTGGIFENLKSVIGFLTKRVKLNYNGEIKIVAFLIFPYKAQVNDGIEIGLKDVL